MLINELPDYCLLTIFDYIKELEDLITCYKVCQKWNNIIFNRTKKIKYLSSNPSCTPNTFFHEKDEPIDVICLIEMFPNLRIVDLTIPFFEKAHLKDIVKLLTDTISLKGIIDNANYYQKLIPECFSFEMISIHRIDLSLSENKNAVKQLYLQSSTLDEFKEVAHYFPNLERLHIRNNEDWTDRLSRWSLMADLKILEMSLSSYDGWDFCYSFAFMDSCPALQSAFIQVNSKFIYIDDSIKHENLQDLVIQFYEPFEWNELIRLISKYPNLKHLALRRNAFKDEDIEQLLLVLPKLTLLDIRGSTGVTKKAASHVRDYCEQYGPSIKFYFTKDDKPIELDWPKLSAEREKIRQGFDFMKNCFFAEHFLYLPHFLDPMDY